MQKSQMNLWKTIRAYDETIVSIFMTVWWLDII
jgi:hypothetical protein